MDILILSPLSTLISQAPAIWKKMYNYDQVALLYIKLEKKPSMFCLTILLFCCSKAILAIMFPSAPLRRVWWWCSVACAQPQPSPSHCSDSYSRLFSTSSPIPSPAHSPSTLLASPPDTQNGTKLVEKCDTQRLRLDSLAF